MQYAIINSIERETDRAILVDAHGQTWLPKSQITIHNIEGWPTVIELPGWLWNKKRSWLSIRTDPQTIFEATGYRIMEV